MAQLGKQIFFDTSLSASGKLACASCHDTGQPLRPANGQLPIVYGGPDMHSPGVRAVPSLIYLNTQQNFYIGPDPAVIATRLPTLPQLAAASSKSVRATKTAQSTAQSAANIVPAGGLFWDGRADTLTAAGDGPADQPVRDGWRQHPDARRQIAGRPLCRTFKQLFGARYFQRSAYRCRRSDVRRGALPDRGSGLPSL